MISSHATEGARLLAEGRPEEAIRKFWSGLAASSRDLECHLGLARAYLSMMKLGEARQALEKLLAVEPRHPEARSHLSLIEANEGDNEALALLRTLSARPEAGFFEHFNLASALQKRGDDAGAEAAYEKAVKVQPRSGHAWFELGILAQRKGDWAKAIERFQKSAELAPSSHVPLHMLSRAHAARGEVGRAVDALKKAVLVGPREKVLYEDLFKLCFTANATEGALTSAKALRALDPRNAHYAYMQGVAHLAAGQVPAARAALTQAQALAPTEWEVKHALARCHQKAKESAAALKLLEEVHAQVPVEPEPANDLAQLYLAKPDPAAAARVLKPALAVRPEDPGLNLNMGLALARLEPAKALRHAQKAQLSKDPEIADQARKLLRTLQAR